MSKHTTLLDTDTRNLPNTLDSPITMGHGNLLEPMPIFMMRTQGVHSSSTVNIHVRAQKGYYLNKHVQNVRIRDILLLSRK